MPKTDARPPLLRAAVLAAALLLAAAPTAAQTRPITIGNHDASDPAGSLSIGTFNGRDQRPFVQAITALLAAPGPDVGGRIEVLPGEYVFTTRLVVGLPGVTITGPRSAVVRRGAGAPGLFAFTAPATGGRLEGLTIADEAAESGVTLVAVDAHEFALDGLRLRLAKDQGPLVEDYVGVSLRARADGPRRGALVSGCDFAFGSDAGGIVGLRSDRGRALRVVGCRFGPLAELDGVARIRSAIHLVDEQWTSVSANTFHELAAPLADDPDHAILVATSSGEEEGHHLVFTGNVLERVSGAAVLHLAGGKFDAITGNVFGRTGAPYGTIRLGPPLTGVREGVGNAIVGNQFHNVTADVDPEREEIALLVTQQSTPKISQNQFTLCDRVQVVLDDVWGASLTGNQFVARRELAEEMPAIPAPIRLRAAKNAYLDGNTALRSEAASTLGWGPSLWIGEETPGLVYTASNRVLE